MHRPAYKKLYNNVITTLDSVQKECQYFKTELARLTCILEKEGENLLVFLSDTTYFYGTTYSLSELGYECLIAQMNSTMLSSQKKTLRTGFTNITLFNRPVQMSKVKTIKQDFT